MLTLGSIFNGIGGFSLAAYWLGILTTWVCEIDKFCNQVFLQDHLDYMGGGKITMYGDIRSINEKNKPGYTDIISASPPCQPFSTAGKRLGTADDRHLWPETLRVFGLLNPRWVICENVLGIDSMAESRRLLAVEGQKTERLPEVDNYEAVLTYEETMLVGSMLQDLKEIGYEPPRLLSGEPIIFCVPAIGVGAYHYRYRFWIIAYSNSGKQKQQREHVGVGREQQPVPKGDISDAMRRGHSRPTQAGSIPGEVGLQQRKAGAEHDRENAVPRIQWPAESPVVGGILGIPNRVDSIKAIGNAIVPQIAAEIFRCILEAEKVFGKAPGHLGAED